MKIYSFDVLLLIKNKSVVPRTVLTSASWLAYRFLKWPGVPISLIIFQSLLSFTQSKLWHSQWSRSRCFSGALLLYWWSNWCSQFDLWFFYLFSVQFSSVAQSCPTLCNPRDYNIPGLPVHHQLLEPTQTHVHHVGDAIHPNISFSVVPFSSVQFSSVAQSCLTLWDPMSTPGLPPSALSKENKKAVLGFCVVFSFHPAFCLGSHMWICAHRLWN